MSGTGCQVLRITGIAERIAISTIVTANNFAISPRLWPGAHTAATACSKQPPLHSAAVLALMRHDILTEKNLTSTELFMNNCSFCFKGEIGGRRFARRDCNLRRLSSQILLPSCHRVAACGNTVDRKIAV